MFWGRAETKDFLFIFLPNRVSVSAEHPQLSIPSCSSPAPALALLTLPRTLPVLPLSPHCPHSLVTSPRAPQLPSDPCPGHLPQPGHIYLGSLHKPPFLGKTSQAWQELLRTLNSWECPGVSPAGGASEELLQHLSELIPKQF